MRAQLKHPRNQRPGKPDGGKDARDKDGRKDQQADTIHDQLESFHGDTNVKRRGAFFKASRWCAFSSKCSTRFHEFF
jgi:hypothetical protein